MTVTTLDPRIVGRLKALLGPQGYSEDPEVIAPLVKDWRGNLGGASILLLRPANTEEVAKVLALCHESGTAIVPQGGNTGLVGGALAQGEPILSLSRLNRIRAVDILNDAVTVDAGCILADIQAAAEKVDRLFPMSLGSEGSCQIGGNLSTNSGGTAVLRYGNMRDLVLGLEVVLADGTMLDGLSGLRKDNTGYDLKQLFIGAEGTLGVITGATLKLFPRPRAVETAFIAVRDPEAAVELLARAQAVSGGAVSGFELIARICLDFVLRHIPGSRDPLAARHDWYVLAEMTAGRASGLRDTMEAVLTEGQEAGLLSDAVLAASEAQREAFWRIRDSISESQNKEGARVAHDVAVPRSRIAGFIAEATRAINAVDPALRVIAFGHIGDGNVHFNVSQAVGASPEAFKTLVPRLSEIVYDLACARGGSISAEHGIGSAKRETIKRYKQPAQLELMRRIKATLDPKGILNPGKVI
ncbi:MAG: FAD-binding oxidoreductase [Alphaproteobacteria bacterium]|nr:FAD-binding oxidoreductase [Alphaproteobacteria bacterium]